MAPPKNAMTVKLLDLVPQYESIRDEIREAIDEVLSTQQFILGKKVEALEAEIARYCGVRWAAGVASGSDAILLSLMGLGIGAGDEVITTPYTFFSTVSSITRLGATPVFVDIDPHSMTMDPHALEQYLIGAGDAQPKAVVPVHLYGHPANLPRIGAIAQTHGMTVIEDCAQAHGATIRGQRVGTFGAAAAFSFYPTKNLGAIGDGGAVATSNPGLAEQVRLLRQYGWRQRYVSESPGKNSRLDELQAAILRVKLARLDADNQHRRALAGEYRRRLSGARLELPAILPG